MCWLVGVASVLILCLRVGCWVSRVHSSWVVVWAVLQAGRCSKVKCVGTALFTSIVNLPIRGLAIRVYVVVSVGRQTSDFSMQIVKFKRGKQLHRYQ